MSYPDHDPDTLCSHSEVSYAIDRAVVEWDVEDGPLRRVLEEEYEYWTENSDAACKIMEDFHEVFVHELAEGGNVSEAIDYAYAMVLLEINSVTCPESTREELVAVAVEARRVFGEHFFGT